MPVHVPNCPRCRRHRQSPLPLACLNCGEPFGASDDRRPRFCPACGQETTLRPPTMGEFAQQFGGAYLATEGALWRSLKLLFLSRAR